MKVIKIAYSRIKILKFKQSSKLLSKALKIIPAQAQTFSKNWTQYPLGQAPIFSDKAKEGYIWDIDGNKFIDWPMALGPLILGHNNKRVNSALVKRLKKGIAFSLPNKLEVELSEKLINWFPYAEAVRFGKNGSDVTSAAVRAARAYTNRDHILCCGYHGWQDWFISTTSRSKGIPKSIKNLTHPFIYNDIDSLKNLLNEYSGKVAVIIMEPMGVEFPNDNFLEEVRRLATLHKVILVFDECWTGFRIHKQGALGLFNISPDTACFGKSLGNGIPISDVLGKKDIMNVFEDIFFSFTFGGDVLGMTAASTVLDIIEDEPVISYIENIGNKLNMGIKDIIKDLDLNEYVSYLGYPGRSSFYFHGDDNDGLLIKSIFQQEAIKEGVLAAGWHAPSYAHTHKDVDKTLNVYRDVFKLIITKIKNNDLNALLKGKMVKPVFRKI